MRKIKAVFGRFALALIVWQYLNVMPNLLVSHFPGDKIRVLKSC